MQTVLLVSAGAIVGANLRYFVAQYVARLVPVSFPCGTLLINFTGSLVLGFFLALTTEKILVDPRWRLLIAVGFCGGYTTYSSYAYETFSLIEQHLWVSALGNMLATNLFCLLAVFVGAVLARAI